MRDIDGRLMTTREVAETLGRSTRNVFRLMDAGRLEPIRLSGSKHGKLKFDPADVAQLVAKSRESRRKVSA